MPSNDYIDAFPTEYQAAWRETERLVAKIRLWRNCSINGDEWIYVGILMRAGELVAAICQLLSLRNFPACAILDRALMELKFRASWLSEDCGRTRLAEYASMIELEHSVLICKMKEGKSLSAQILNHLFGGSIGKTSHRDRARRSSVLQLAEQADLAFDYDIPYWAESLYVHSHPLSLAMHRPKSSSPSAPFSDAILDITSGKAVPLQLYCGVPSTFAWILEYILKCFPHPVSKTEIEGFHNLLSDTMNRATGGRWTTSPDVPPGGLSLTTDEGTTTFQRKQRKA